MSQMPRWHRGPPKRARQPNDLVRILHFPSSPKLAVRTLFLRCLYRAHANACGLVAYSRANAQLQAPREYINTCTCTASAAAPRISSPSSLSLHADFQVMHGASRLEEAWLPQLQPLQRFGSTVLPMLYCPQESNHPTIALINTT